MEQIGSTEIATYTFAAVALIAIIARAYYLRHKLRGVASSSGEFDFQNAAPFDLAYAVNTEIAARPNTEIVPGLYLYFNDSDKPRVFYRQRKNSLPNENGSHPYFVRIAQNDVTDLEWLAVERRTELPVQKPGSRVECRVHARTSEATTAKLLFIYQAETGEETRIELGPCHLSNEFSEFEMKVNLDDYRFKITDERILLRFVVLPEIKQNLNLDIRSWDFEIVKTA